VDVDAPALGRGEEDPAAPDRHLLQHLDDASAERHRALRAGRLRVIRQPALRERAPHAEHPPLEVDVAPLAAERLLRPQPGSAQEHDERCPDLVELLADRVDLVPRIERIDLARLRLRVLDQRRRVVLDPLPPLRRRQHVPQRPQPATALAQAVGDA
jgi:hypothetical protein